MFDLQMTVDLTRFSLVSGSGCLTLAVLYALIRINILITVPAFLEASRVLAHRLGRRVPKLYIKFESMAVVWPFAIGTTLGFLYFFDRDTFLWYVHDAMILWPDYGPLTCWAINVGAALFAANALTLCVAMVRIYHLAGVLAASGFTALSLGCFFAGIMFGPAGVLVMLSRFTRGFIPDSKRIWRWAWGS